MRERIQRLGWVLEVLIDALATQAAFLLAWWVRYELQWIKPVEEAYYLPYRAYIPASVLMTGLVLAAYGMEGLYSAPRGRGFFDELYGVFSGTINGVVVMIVITYLNPSLSSSRLIFLYALVFMVLLVGIGRGIKRWVLARLRRRGIGVQRVLIVGAGEVGRTVMRTIVARPELGYQIVGFVDDNPEKGNGVIGRFPGLGGVDRLPEVVREQQVDVVIVTLPWTYHRKILQVVAQCERERIEAYIVPDFLQMSISRVRVERLDGVPMLGVRESAIRGGNRLIKRAMDVIGALLALAVAAPLMGVIALAIRLDSPGPILFRQVRIGKGGRPFVLYKFRTMYEGADQQRELLRDRNEADGPLFKIRDDPRRTRVGRLLRRLSLDELPQLYNVLRGEMSLVGPRPPLPEEVEQYKPWQRRRLEALPGITGLWQVSGRSDLTFDEMCLLDIYYLENWSPVLDLHILLRTIPKVLLGEGAY